MKPWHIQSQWASPYCVEYAYLEGVAAIGLAINHFHDILIHRLTTLVTITPVVGRAYTIFTHIEVLGVVNVLVGPCLDTVDNLQKLLSTRSPRQYRIVRTHPRFQIDQNSSGNISRVVALVIKDIFAVTTLGREVLEVSILADTMFLAELLPELASNCAYE
jgi:hypothetical protein